jgi:hypothetical protein
MRCASATTVVVRQYAAFCGFAGIFTIGPRQIDIHWIALAGYHSQKCSPVEK